MKRMSEVLTIELPTCPEDLLHAMVHETSLAEDSAIAHAINHVDSLADALDACIKTLGNMPVGEPVNDSDRAYHQALDALNAYRGDK